jgi:hypothetical protein
MLGRLGRSRWAAVGAAIAIVAGAGGILTASAATSSPSVLVPIPPCRLMDTRPETQVGTRNTPIAQGDTYFATVIGTNGGCTIPAGASAVSMNVTIVNPTASSFLTVFPGDSARPTASSLNWVGGQSATPNAVTSQIGNQTVGFYNNTGSVDLIVDIVGYYQPNTGGSGPPGAPGRSALDPLPSGTTVTGSAYTDMQGPANTGDYAYTVALPFTPTAPFVEANIKFQNESRVTPGQVSPLCNGSSADPTAPPGMLCIYVFTANTGATGISAARIRPSDTRNIFVAWGGATTSGDAYLNISWAYTAP